MQSSNSRHYLSLIALSLLVKQGLAQDEIKVDEPSAETPNLQAPTETPTPQPTPAAAIGNVISLTAPVKQRGAFIGEVDIKVGADGSGLMVNASHITSLFKDKLTPEAQQRLNALPKGRYISAAEAKELGLDMSFNLADAAVVASVSGSARTLTELSLARAVRSATPNTGRAPTGVSAYLNMFASASANDFGGDYKFNDPSFSFDGAIHIAPLKHMTLEAFGSLDNNNDFNRGDVRAVWRSRDTANNWQLRVGDVGTPGISYMGGTSVQGVEFTNSDTRSGNNAGVSGVGNRQFFLDRPAVARLLIDGRETRRFNLEPGPYDVKDFPLTNGANNVAFIIEDDRGEVERIEFNVFSDTSLVSLGEYRYGVSLGRGLSDDGGAYDYDSANRLFSGYFETGITPALSMGAGVQLTDTAKLGIATAKFGASLGRFDFETATFQPDEGESGQAAKLTWRNNRNNSEQKNPPSLAFGVSYKSEYFGGLFEDSTFNEEARRFDAAYSQTLFNDISFGVSSSFTQNRTINDSYKHTLSLSKSFGKWGLSTSFSYRDDGDEAGWDGLLTASYDFNKRVHIDSRFGYDADGKKIAELDISSDYSYDKGMRVGNGMLDYDIGISANADENGDRNVSVSGGIDYTANRFEFSVNHSADVESLIDGESGQRTTVRAGMALAFADGQFAVGRPIDDSFAIFSAHDSIADKKLLIGNSNDEGVYTAQSDGFGALLTNISSGATQVSNVRFDAEDLPLGYDLGTGMTSLAAHYKSGFAVEVGSAYNVIATATLLDKYDRPVKLLLGKATEMDVPEGRSADAFTDGEGRMSASGISAGRWKLEMFAKKPLSYIFTVPQGKTGIVELGTLKPVAQDL